MINMKYIFPLLILCSLFLQGCDIDKWELPDQSNESIPNYTLRAANTPVSPTMLTTLYQEDDNNFITCIESLDDSIDIIRITQSFALDQWDVQSSQLNSLAGNNLSGFIQVDNISLIAYDNVEKPTLVLLEDYDNELFRFDEFETYLDTAYNNVDSIEIRSLTLASDSLSYFVGGKLFSFGRSYSFVMGFDSQLSPQWIKTYFEDSSIDGILNTNGDTLLMIHTNDDGSDIIRDNSKGEIYQKINIADISFDQLYFGSELDFHGNNIIVSGVNNSVGRIIRIDLNNLSSYIIESEIYPVGQLSTIRLSRDTWAVAGVQTGGEDKFFITEMNDLGSQWCHRYTNAKYVRTFGLTENQGKGISALGLVEDGDSYFIQLIRIDEEGATFIDEFTESCI